MKSKILTPPAEYRRLSDEELLYRFSNRKDQMSVYCLFERYGHLVGAACMNYLQNKDLTLKISEKVFIDLIKDAPQITSQDLKMYLVQKTKEYCREESGYGPDKISDPFNMDQEREEILDKDILKLIKESHFDKLLSTELKKLSGASGKCIELFYLKKRTHREIEKITGFKAGEIRRYINEGVCYLKTKIAASAEIR